MIVGAQAGEPLPKTASYLADITKIGKSIKCAASSDKDFLRAGTPLIIVEYIAAFFLIPVLFSFTPG